MIRVIMAASNLDSVQQVEQLIAGAVDLELAQKADNLDSFKSMLTSPDWQVCLLPLSYPTEILRDFIVYLNRVNPDGKVILLSDSSNQEQILDLLSLGASGFLEYKDIKKFIIKAIGKVWLGEAWIPRSMVASILERLTWLNSFSDISGTDCTKVQ